MKRPISIDESKAVQVEMLVAIHDFCEKFHLTYYLMFGTLLGAIRHKGFIPWDDDTDICMPRKDYDYFMQNFNINNSSHIRAICCDTDEKYYSPVGKVIDTRTGMKEPVTDSKEIGVFVDVFPLDNRPDDITQNKRFTNKVLLFRRILAIKLNPGSRKRKRLRRAIHFALNHLCRKMDMNKVARRINTIARTYNDYCCKRYGILANTDERGASREYNKEWFRKKILVQFEDNLFYAPAMFDDVLTYIYNDYMEYPPIEERVCPHPYETWWKE